MTEEEKRKQEKAKRELKNDFLAENVFHDLDDLNDGFDVPCIAYYNARQFKKVLERVEKLGIGIYGIEPWKDGDYYDVRCCPKDKSPTDPTWYKAAFEEFESRGVKLQYSASYHVPDELLNKKKK